MKRTTARRPKSAVRKGPKKRAAKGRRAAPKANELKPPQTPEALVAASAQALGFHIDPLWTDRIAFNLRLILNHAALIDEFPLPDNSEPAPVFRA